MTTRRRTFTSWLMDEDFTDLPALTARLLPSPSQDALAKYLYDHLGPDTRRLL